VLLLAAWLQPAGEGARTIPDEKVKIH